MINIPFNPGNSDRHPSDPQGEIIELFRSRVPQIDNAISNGGEAVAKTAYRNAQTKRTAAQFATLQETEIPVPLQPEIAPVSVQPLPDNVRDIDVFRARAKDEAKLASETNIDPESSYAEKIPA